MNFRNMGSSDVLKSFPATALSLLLLFLTLATNAKPVFAKPRVATLEVQVIRSPDRIDWGNQRAIDRPQNVRFQWKTSEPEVYSAVWKVGETQFVSGEKEPHILAQGALDTVPDSEHGSSFWIDFGQFLPRLTETVRKYYVQVRVLSRMGESLGTTNAVEVSYVKGRPAISFPEAQPAVTKINLRVTTTGILPLTLPLLIQTADVDLNVDINFRNGSTRTLRNMNHGFKWKMNTVQVVTIPFDEPIDIREIKSLRLWAVLYPNTTWKMEVEVVVFFIYKNKVFPVLGPVGYHSFSKDKDSLTIPIYMPEDYIMELLDWEAAGRP